MPENPKKAVRMSAIIAKAIRARVWSDPGIEPFQGPGQIQEVQSMLFNNKIYIAANRSECRLIKNFLNAFGVRNKDSFRNCLKYTHWIVATPRDDLRVYIDKPYEFGYSDTEQAAINLSNSIMDYNISQSDRDEVGKIINAHFPINGNINNAYNENRLRPAQRQLGWFLRKLSGVNGNMQRQALFAKANGSVCNNDKIGVCVVDDESLVHAELKLLTRLTMLATNPDTSAESLHKEAVVGGLKKACRHCQPWMDHFRSWARRQFGITVTYLAPQPGADPRPSGSGEGERPDLNTENIKIPRQNLGNDKLLFDKLFNGQKNDSHTDLNELDPL